MDRCQPFQGGGSGHEHPVEDVRVSGDEAVVTIRLDTTDTTQAHVRLETGWWEIEGQPRLVRAWQV